MCLCWVCMWGSPIKICQILNKINMQSFDYFFLSTSSVFFSRKEISLVWCDFFLISLSWLLVISFFTFHIVYLIINSEFFLQLNYLYILVFSWTVLWNYIILIQAVRGIWMMIFWVGIWLDQPSSPGRCWHCCFQLLSKDIATAPAELISHQYTPVVFKGAALYGKDTSETLFSVVGKDPDFEVGFYFRLISFIAWELWIAVCWRGGRTEPSRC